MKETIFYNIDIDYEIPTDDYKNEYDIESYDYMKDYNMCDCDSENDLSLKENNRYRYKKIYKISFISSITFLVFIFYWSIIELYRV